MKVNILYINFVLVYILPDKRHQFCTGCRKGSVGGNYSYGL